MTPKAVSQVTLKRKLEEIQAENALLKSHAAVLLARLAVAQPVPSWSMSGPGGGAAALVALLSGEDMLHNASGGSLYLNESQKALLVPWLALFATLGKFACVPPQPEMAQAACEMAKHLLKTGQISYSDPSPLHVLRSYTTVIAVVES